MAESAPLPPQNLDAEESVLGAMMLSPHAIDAVTELVSPRDFYRESHATIFRACLHLHNESKPVDALTVADHLQTAGELEGIGGKARIHELATLVPATTSAAHYARIVRRKAVERGLTVVGERIQRLGWEGAEDTPALLAQAEGLVFDLAQGGARTDFVRLGDAVSETVTRLEELHAGGQEIIGLPSGFDVLDRLTQGWQPGNLIIVAGRPSMGKGLKLDANVLTPNGWRRNGDLAVGDFVIGADGAFDTVTGVHDRGVLPFYRVRFSDGAEVECSGDHLWLTRDRLERRRGVPGSVRDTEQIAGSLLRPDSHGWNHTIPYMQPASFVQPRSLPLDPYWLGLWLGDGSCSGSQVRFTNPEADLQARFAALVAVEDTATVVADRQRCPTVGVRRKIRNNQKSGTLRALAALGLADCRSHEKFVPDAYLLAPPPLRAEILRGLCDTDGYVTDPHGACVEITTTSPRLRDGILFLVGSLGGRASYTTRPGMYVRDGNRVAARENHRIVLSFPAGGLRPVSSRKHLAKWQDGAHLRSRERAIVAVEPAGSHECRCITVGRGLYVTDRFVVTHNSALATAFASQTVLRQNLPAALFTLEMSRSEVVQRLLSSEALVEAQKLRNGRMDGADWRNVMEWSGRLSRAPLFIDDNRLISPTEIRSKARRLKLRHPNLALVVVDYLQLMARAVSSSERVNEVAQISRSLKILAGELELPVIALSQLSRALETRHDRRPILSDLRDSGAIEQDADLVVFIYRDEVYNAESTDQQGIAELNLAKHRNGPTDTVKVSFVKRYAKFSPLPRAGAGDPR